MNKNEFRNKMNAGTKINIGMEMGMGKYTI